MHRRAWTLVAIHEDAGLSGKTLNRAEVAAALAAVESGEAAALVVAKPDRLSRSLLDFAGLMARARASDWNLVALDLGIDLSTPAGEFMANVMAPAAQWERRNIGQRTRDALAVKRQQGVRLGRPSVLPGRVVAHLLSARRAGSGWSAIARELNLQEVPTAHGGVKWYPSTVQAVCMGYEVTA